MLGADLVSGSSHPNLFIKFMATRSHQSPLPANEAEGAFPPPRDIDNSLDRPTPTLRLAEGGQILEVLPLPELADGPHDLPRALVIPVLDPSLFVTLTSFPETCLPLARTRVSPVCSFPPPTRSSAAPSGSRRTLARSSPEELRRVQAD